LTVAPPEFLHPARGINDFLFAGEKRMTGGTDLDMKFCLCRARFKGITAGTGYDTLPILGVNFLSHNLLL